MRQLAINPHGINWTSYSPPVVNTQPIGLTQSRCIAAVVVFCSNVAPQSCRSAREAPLASSLLSGIPSTRSACSEDVDTDASVCRTPPYYRNKASPSACVAHHREHDCPCSAEPGRASAALCDKKYIPLYIAILCSRFFESIFQLNNQKIISIILVIVSNLEKSISSQP